jgi:hypothetical protein
MVKGIENIIAEKITTMKEVQNSYNLVLNLSS